MTDPRIKNKDTSLPLLIPLNIYDSFFKFGQLKSCVCSRKIFSGVSIEKPHILHIYITLLQDKIPSQFVNGYFLARR